MPEHETEAVARDRTTDDWEARVGEQVRALRVDAGLDQAALASRADLSVSTVQSLENGRGSTLRSLIRVLRALDAERVLETIAPTSTISPLDVLRSAAVEPRRRVFRPRSTGGGTGGRAGGGS